VSERQRANHHCSALLPRGGVSDGLLLDGVSAAYRDTTVLHEVDLRVSRGELLVVLGPSGAGKSTVLRVGAGP
jgi:ABC-type Fe3+/spermidine/putrescine transport system ATPase subunit